MKTEGAILKNFSFEGGFLRCDALLDDDRVLRRLKVLSPGPIRYFPRSPTTFGLVIGERYAIPLEEARLPDKMAPGEWGVDSTGHWSVHRHTQTLSVFGAIRLFMDMVLGIVKVRLLQFFAFLPWVKIKLDQELRIEARQAENLPRFADVVVNPRALRASAVVYHRDGNQSAWKFDLRENSMKFFGDWVEVSVDQSGNIAIKNHKARVNLLPSGEAIVSTERGHLRILPGGFVEIRTPTPISDQKVLTSKTVVCPLMGLLEPFGDPTVTVGPKTG